MKCRMAIKGNVVKFEDQPYHPECFICEQCRIPLSGLLTAACNFSDIETPLAFTATKNFPRNSWSNFIAFD